MEKTIWHFINSGKCCPSYNMALDEALLEWHSKGEIGPVLRFYEWEPATLSIGYFQSVEKEIDLEQLRNTDLGFVRRPTGGRGVLHEHELTYSVIVTKNIRNARNGYRGISGHFGGSARRLPNLGLMLIFQFRISKEQNDRLEKTEKCCLFRCAELV